jgi:ribonuclease-3
VAYKEVNFKSKLLEWSQKNRVKMEFRDVKQERDENKSPVFTTQVFIEGLEGCIGIGYSKKESQQNASKDTLQRLRREPQFIDAVFAAKGDRTKMEEEPVMSVPDPEKEQQQSIFVEQANASSFVETAELQVTSTEPEADEFTLDDIIAVPREKTREEIIAEAEAAAFAED